MKILRRWAGQRPAWAAPVRANRDVGSKTTGIPEGQRRRSANRELTSTKFQKHYDEQPTAKLDDRDRRGTEPAATRGLELYQEHAKVVLAALEDAAALRWEVIGNCPDCRSSDERVCVDHQGSWETAEDYDSLRRQLDSSCHGNETDRTRKTDALNPGEPQDGGTPEPDEYAPPAVPDTSRSVPPEVYNAIADYAREVNRLARGPDGAPNVSPDEETAVAELVSDSQPDPGPTEDQITSWNEANDYWNEANDYEPDREAGE